MKAIVVVILLLEAISCVQSVPLENHHVTQEDRQKRQFLQTAVTPSGTFASSHAAFSTVPQVVASHAAVPQQLVAATPAVRIPRGHHAESIVINSGPDHYYFIHQRYRPQIIHLASLQFHPLKAVQAAAPAVASAPVVTVNP